ncbi:MAG: hypothetical protein ACI9FD_003228, partial [Gammaproteobacteria bacterium]
MSSNFHNRAHKIIDGRDFIFYDGYWIRFYQPPENSYQEKKVLIDALTRRTFHHCEPGINTPGYRLEQAREAWENEEDIERKRVNAAMLAGALFNRATDIFTSVVEMEQKGIKISRQNELLRQCGDCFQEALELGKCVRHYSGQEGVDEMWGEPFRVFTLPIEDYYESRYIKISQTMHTIDKICGRMIEVFGIVLDAPKVSEYLVRFADTAKNYTETMKSDEDFFMIWPDYVVASDQLTQAVVNSEADYPSAKLIYRGRDLINYISAVR